jgi:dihydroflavonol-4-reductase
MTTVVTGAAGHLGANLVRRLLQRGDTVRAVIHRHDSALEGLDVQRVHADVRDPDAVLRAFQGADVVYHLAAIISIDGSKGGLVPAVNIGGVRNVAEAALACGVRRLVHCSSIHAFDQEPLEQPLDETRSRADERPGHPAYDESKARGEREVRKVVARGLDAVIVNPTAILGPNDFLGSRLGRTFLELYHRRLPSLLEGGFDWVDARDVCDAAMAAAEHGRNGESYLLGGHWASVRSLAEIVQRHTGVAPPRWTSPMWLARLFAPCAVAYGRLRGVEPLYTGEALRALRANRNISCSRAAAELGHRPRPLDETVRDSLEWLEQHGRLPRGAVKAV